jgi:hypothetical protein
VSIHVNYFGYEAFEIRPNIWCRRDLIYLNPGIIYIELQETLARRYFGSRPAEFEMRLEKPFCLIGLPGCS